MNDIDIKCFWSQGKAKHSVIEFYRREDIKNIKKCIRGKRTSEWKCQNGSNIDNKKNEHRRLLNWEGLHPLGGSFKDFFHVWGAYKYDWKLKKYINEKIKVNLKRLGLYLRTTMSINGLEFWWEVLKHWLTWQINCRSLPESDWKI